MGVHGMVLFGTPDDAYLSHIPMFHAPHDVQLVLRGKLTGTELTTYSDGLYTFVPSDSMSLDELRLGKNRHLRGTIHRGNFEQGGQALPGEPRFEATAVVHQHELDRAAASPGAYLVFGDVWAVRLIGGEPGVDQVLRLGAPLAAGTYRLAAEGLPRSGTLALAGGVTAVIERELSCLVGPDFTAACP
jgi:hypothetical protein